jgi:2'-5' RNA ligase
MRIFIALDIDDAIRLRIARFMEGVRGFAPDARWIKPESLHVTLKFIGEKPEAAVEEIRQGLSSLAAESVFLDFRGYGFFPTAKSARVFWIGVHGSPALAALAGTVDKAVKATGVPGEDRPFSPHLTLARRRGASGAPPRRTDDAANSNFRHLQEKLSGLPAPEFGSMTAREFFLYESQPRPGGSQYTKIASFPLR